MQAGRLAGGNTVVCKSPISTHSKSSVAAELKVKDRTTTTTQPHTPSSVAAPTSVSNRAVSTPRLFAGPKICQQSGQNQLEQPCSQRDVVTAFSTVLSTLNGARSQQVNDVRRSTFKAAAICTTSISHSQMASDEMKMGRNNGNKESPADDDWERMIDNGVSFQWLKEDECTR